MNVREWVVPWVFLFGVAGAVGGQAASDTTEDSETNDFSEFAWAHTGDADWDITAQERHSGVYSAKAGAITDSERSSLQVTLDCATGTIAFYCKVSSESGFDCLKFCIDGVEQDKWSGEKDWAEVSFPVAEGTRTFEWTYSKDGSVSGGEDTAWIDDIVFPGARKARKALWYMRVQTAAWSTRPTRMKGRPIRSTSSRTSRTAATWAAALPSQTCPS